MGVIATLTVKFITKWEIHESNRFAGHTAKILPRADGAT